MDARSKKTDYATLFLARAILEDDASMARAALEAGGSLAGSWIDGKTALRDLPKKLGSKKVQALLADLLAPAKTRRLPSYRPLSKDPEQEEYWSREFVLFAARRGYDFDGRTILMSGAPGSDLPPFATVRSAVSKIESSWGRAKLVTTNDGDGKQAGSSFWRVEFEEDWRRDTRIAGFKVTFRVDAKEWDLFEAYRDGDFSVRHEGPDPMDPMLDRQKVWEGLRIMERLLDKSFTLDDVVAAIRKGADPFWNLDGKMLGEFGHEPPEIKAFMARVRELCAPEVGFHRRLAPHLAKASLSSLVAAADLEASTPTADSKRKTLAQGRTGAL